MFYSVQIVSKGGPLQVIWLAAHMDRQLKRQQVFDTSIPFSVDTIIKGPGKEPPLALRLSGQLLLGVVKVYARKVAYLAQDCDDALHKMGALMHAPSDGVDAAGGSGLMPSPAPRHLHGKHGKPGAADPSSLHGAGQDEEHAGAWPGIEEDVFSSQPSLRLQLGTERSSDGSGLVPALSLRPSDSTATLRTPAVAHRMASSVGPGAGAGAVLQGGRALSYATSMPHPMDLDDEMFEAVPEHFEFDLEDFEVDALTAPAAALPSSQQMSTLQLQATQPVEAAPSEAEEPAAAVDAGGGSGKKPQTPQADMEQDLFDFGPDAPGTEDQQATLCYEPDEEAADAAQARSLSPDSPLRGAGDAPENDDPGPSSPAKRPSRTKAAAAAATAAAGASTKAGAEPAATRTPPRKKPSPATAAVAPAVVATPAKQEGRSKPSAAAAAAAPQRPRLALSHAKAIIDVSGTTLANAEYRANLTDRSLLLRKKHSAALGAAAAAGSGKMLLGSNSAPGILAAAASGQLLPLTEARQASLSVIYHMLAWSHPALRAMYANAFGIGPPALDAAPQQPAALQEPAAPGGSGGSEQDMDVELGQRAPETLPSLVDSEAADLGGQQEGSGLQRQLSGLSGSVLAPDIFRDEVLDVFHESRRTPDVESEEEEQGWEGREGVARDVGAGVSDVGLTPRTEALLRQLERLDQASQRRRRGPVKRPRLEEGEGEEAAPPEADASAAGTPDEGAVRLSQLLLQEAAVGGPKSRAAAARAAAPPLLLRQAAAQTFYDLLVLQNRGYVQLEQSRAYEDLRVIQRVR